MINKKIKPDDLIRRAFPLKKLARTNQLYMKNRLDCYIFVVIDRYVCAIGISCLRTKSLKSRI